MLSGWLRIRSPDVDILTDGKHVICVIEKLGPVLVLGESFLREKKYGPPQRSSMLIRLLIMAKLVLSCFIQKLLYCGLINPFLNSPVAYMIKVSPYWGYCELVLIWCGLVTVSPFCISLLLRLQSLMKKRSLLRSCQFYCILYILICLCFPFQKLRLSSCRGRSSLHFQCLLLGKFKRGRERELHVWFLFPEAKVLFVSLWGCLFRFFVPYESLFRFLE